MVHLRGRSQRPHSSSSCPRPPHMHWPLGVCETASVFLVWKRRLFLLLLQFRTKAHHTQDLLSVFQWSIHFSIRCRKRGRSEPWVLDRENPPKFIHPNVMLELVTGCRLPVKCATRKIGSTCISSTLHNCQCLHESVTALQRAFVVDLE